MATLASFPILIHTRRRQLRLPCEVRLFISIVAVSGIFVFVMLGMPAWSLYRAAGYVSIGAALFPLICSEFLAIFFRRRVITRSGKRFVRFLMVVLITTLSMTSTVLRFEQNVYAGELEHPSELSCLSYLFDSSSHPLTIAVSWRTSIYYKYFDYASKDKVLMYVDIWKTVEREIKIENHSEVALYLKNAIAESAVLVRGTRDYYLIYGNYPDNLDLVEAIDNETLSARLCKTYANGYWSLYLRTQEAERQERSIRYRFLDTQD
jgi:hypothetical protein